MQKNPTARDLTVNLVATIPCMRHTCQQAYLTAACFIDKFRNTTNNSSCFAGQEPSAIRLSTYDGGVERACLHFTG
jgi:hypothetical protein